MGDQDTGYVQALAGELSTTRPDLLDLAEDELRVLRTFKAAVARFIHNEAIALDIRQGLARDLNLPQPTR